LFQKSVRRFSYVSGAVGVAVLIVLMLTTGVDVIGRYVFHRPFIGAYEISELSMATVVLLGWGYTQAEKTHIDIDVLYTRLPRAVRTVLDFLIPLLGLVLFVFIAWQSINFTMDSIGWHEATEMLHIPVWIFKLLIFIGAVAISLEFIVDIIATCQKVQRKT
jgi:TRAP-type C4-dicarboxylate transport system permease small subunit